MFLASRVTVIGDILVDEYVKGRVTRVSPEAPIPVLQYASTGRSVGGAANVAANLQTLGAHVTLLGTVGEDEPGRWALEALKRQNVDVSRVIVDPAASTIRKVRYGTEQQNILRVDYESPGRLAPSVEARLSELLYEATKSAEGLLVSDYNKGMLYGTIDNNAILFAINDVAGRMNLVGVDTKRKGPDLAVYAGATFIKPNLSELEAAVGVVGTGYDLADACERFLAFSLAQSVLVTLGHMGMYHFRRELGGQHVQTIPCNVYDVTGAGDTAFAAVALALCSGYDWTAAIRLANIAASLAVEKHGTHAVSISEILERVNQLATSGSEYVRSIGV